MRNIADTTVLDVLCPMHVVLGPEGYINHTGPTVQKLSMEEPLVGQNFFDVFKVKRPTKVQSPADLRRTMGTKMHLSLNATPETDLKAVLVPLNNARKELIVNLSFGISILDGVRTYSLSNADFAATDLAIEMLYLIEAKSAAMEASRSLNLRLQGAKIAAEEQAFTDTLTGLKNRRALDHILGRIVQGGRGFAVMQIDLDYFKAVNDTLGHAAGDHVLQTVAQIMVEETRESDTIARVGGDEFTVILPDIDTEDTLLSVGHRLIARLEAPIAFQAHECRISASIGTVWVRDLQPVVAQDILEAADAALYQSKNAGRARQTLVKATSIQTEKHLL